MIRVAAQHTSSPRSSNDSDEESSSEPLLGSDTPKLSSNEAAWAVRSLRIVRLVALAGSFMFVGPMLILTNVYLLKTAHFPYPMALCAIAVSGGGGFAHLAVAMGWTTLSPAAKSRVAGPNFYTRVLPIGVFMATSISLGNAAYLFLGVGMIQMLKAATPLLTLLMFAAVGFEVPSRRVAAAVLLITAGTLVTVNGAPGVSAVGVAIMLSSSFAESGRLICTQRLLTGHASFTVVEGQYFISPAAALVLLSGAMVREVPMMVANGPETLATIRAEWPGFALSIALGTSINYLQFMLIQELGGVALKVMSTVRNVLLVAHSAVFRGEAVTGREITGYCVTLVGFAAFSYYRSTEALLRDSTCTQKGGSNSLPLEESSSAPLLQISGDVNDSTANIHEISDDQLLSRESSSETAADGSASTSPRVDPPKVARSSLDRSNDNSGGSGEGERNDEVGASYANLSMHLRTNSASMTPQLPIGGSLATSNEAVGLR